ncbi:hypothetical protein JCM13304A_13180 [Desulfothermus okinawensis JCM 13304]
MRILVAVDKNPYSSYVVHEVGKLAVNTWSDITLLGVIKPEEAPNRIEDSDLAKTLLDYREIITSYYPKGECPYSREEISTFTTPKDNVFVGVGKGGLKTLKIIIKKGTNIVDEILEQSTEDDSTLIILGCNKTNGCKWGELDIPAKIANQAPCSVLIVKENKSPKQIVCCLDHDYITQNSLELINQMVTLYKAELKIVGVSEAGSLKIKVENTMKNLFMYYLKQDIPMWLEVIDSSVFHTFVNQISQDNLIAIWFGRKSFLRKFLPNEKIINLINTTPSSVLLLR